MSEVTDRLLIAVARRRRWASLGRWFVRFTLVAAVGYAVWLIVARLGLAPDWASPLAVLVVPVVAGLAAALVPRRCDRLDAARLADDRLASCDLFLTHTCEQRRQAMGAYGPLVTEAAESMAKRASAAAIVPWNVGPGAARVAIVLAVVAAASWWTPAFDPFGAAADRRQIADRRRAIDEQSKAAAKRIDQLRQQPLDKKNTKQVDQALAELKKTLDEMKADQPKQNLDKLAQQQKKLAADWKSKSAEDLRRNDRGASGQRFGAADQQKMDQWNQKLRAGDPSALKQQMDQIAKLAEKLADAKTDAGRQELAKQMRQKLDDLADFADRHASSTGLEQAMERARSAAQMAGDPELGDQAREAMRQAMEQAGLEADQIAQQLRELDALSDALRSVQMARALNQGDRGLDGQQA